MEMRITQDRLYKIGESLKTIKANLTKQIKFDVERTEDTIEPEHLQNYMEIQAILKHFEDVGIDVNYKE
jgi:hypothetical protein